MQNIVSARSFEIHARAIHADPQTPLSAPMDTRGPRDLSQLLFWPVLTVWLALKLWLTFTKYFNADEYESLHIGWLLHQGRQLYVDFKANHPPLVFEALSLLNYVSSDPVTLLMLGRLVRLVCTLLVLWLVVRIARDVFGPRAARWAAILFCASIICLEYSTLVRVDMFMLPLWLGGIAVLVDRSEWKESRRLFCAGLLAGLAFCANQKVALLGAPCALFVLIGGGDRRWKPRHVLAGLVGALLPIGFYLARAAWHGTLASFVGGVFATGAELVSVDVYEEEETTTFFVGLSRDPALLALSVVAFLWAVRRWRCLDRRQKFLLLSCPWLWATLYFTPCPLPYYLECVFPLFVVLAGGFLASLQLSVPMIRRKRVAIAALCLLMIALPTARFVRIVNHPNDYQSQVLTLATELTDGQDAVFDGSGATITRPDAYSFHWILWKRERWRLRNGLIPRIVPELRKNECRLVIKNRRIEALPEPDESELWRCFVQLWGPLYVPGFDSQDPVGGQDAEFDLWYDGTYELNPPRLVIDAVERQGSAQLSAGRHRVRVPGGPARVQIRDASYRRRVTLPDHPAPQRNLVP